MKATGIVRKMDPLGRVVLPRELRKTMNIDKDTPLEIYTDENKIVLKIYKPGCTFCDSMDNLAQYMDKYICKSCRIALLKVKEI